MTRSNVVIIAFLQISYLLLLLLLVCVKMQQAMYLSVCHLLRKQNNQPLFYGLQCSLGTV